MKRRGSPPSSLPSRVFGLDLRSLAAFRVGLALFILYDLISRSFDLTAHYTDLGVIPRALVQQHYSWSPAFFSVHWLTGSAFGIALIFAVHAIAALGMLWGYRTRLMTFIVWFLLSSLHTRNPLVLSGGDDLLRVILFFAIFLPLGARYSIDAALNSSPEDSPDTAMYVSPSTAVYYLQFIAVYFFSALLKSGAEWRSEGTAIYYALNIDQYALPLGKALLGFPELLKTLSFAVWWVELLGGFIFLIPQPLAKLSGILLFAGLQSGFATTLALGHFPWVNAITLLPFLPAATWNSSRARNRIEIVYDPDCGFCRKLVLILVEFLCPGLIKPPRAAHGRDLAVLRRENSWIVRDDRGAEFFRFDALLQAISSSPLFFWAAPLLRLRPFHFMGTAAYRLVARRRRLFARVVLPFSFRPVRLKPPWLLEALAIFFLVAVLIYNAAFLVPMRGLSRYFEIPTLLVRLDEYWGMFAPAPSREDGWYVVEGRLQGGAMVEAFREQREIRYEKPHAAAEFYPNDRWRRYMMNIWLKEFKEFRAPFGRYLCWNWNRRNSGPDHLEQVRVVFMLETTPHQGKPGASKN